MPRTLRTLLLSATALGALATAAAAAPPQMPTQLQDPAMRAHMNQYGVDADQMREWHQAGRSVHDMHEVGDHDHVGHHGTQGR